MLYFTAALDALDSRTVKTIGRVPVLPSAALALPIDSATGLLLEAAIVWPSWGAKIHAVVFEPGACPVAELADLQIELLPLL